MNLNECKSSYHNNYDENEVKKYEKGITQLKSGSTESNQSFFPLAIDDYFMAVAILSGCSTESKVTMQ